MKRLIIIFLAIAFTSPAFAQTTVVTLPVGDWASSLLTTTLSVLGVIITYAMRFLPGQIQSVIRTSQVDQMLVKAIGYGINTTVGAAKGKALSFDVGSSVVAEAVNYVIQNGPIWLIRWLGGEEGIRARIIARLDVEPNVALK